jgi:two-component system, NtrC family, nitrogen regulation sensor histidine kinase NtrY
MKKNLRKYIYLLFAIVCTLLAVFSENGLLFKNPEKKLIERFQRRLNQKEILLNGEMEKIREMASRPGFSYNFLGDLNTYNSSLEENGTGYLIYRNGRLFYWSNRSIAFSEYLPVGHEPDSKVVHFPNGYYLTRSIEADTLSIVGLILIKNDFPHENEFLVNDFYEGLKLPASFALVKAGSANGTPIKNIDGEVIFDILPKGELLCTTRQLYFPGILYLAGLIFLILFARILISEINPAIGLRMLFMGSFLFFLYWIHILFRFPKVFYHLDFFSPAQFAYSFWLPSLGDFFILSAFFFYFMLNIYKDLRFVHLEKNIEIPRKYLSVVLLLLTCLAYLLINFFIRKLIYNSSFSFTLNQINEITVQTALGMASIMLLLFGLVLLTIRVIDETRRFLSVRETLLIIIVITLLVALIYRLLTRITFPEPLILFAVISALASSFSPSSSRKFGMSYLILFISVITIFSLEVIYRITVQKEREVQQLMAVTLVAEHDPAAEVFLAEIQQQINVDPNIPGYLLQHYENLEEYIELTYFSGYFRQYDLQITICSGSDSLIVHPQNTLVPCFPFFDNMIEKEGNPLPGTSFYFMENMNGRISYFGKIHYPLTSDSIGISIFVELNSKILSEGIGFPELLIDKSMRKPASYKRFEYAKYYGGELVDRHGDYLYNYYIYSYDFEDTEFNYNTWDGYEHLIYGTHQDNYIIVSRSLYTFVDYLISFPYLFVFYFAFSLVTLLFIRPAFRNLKFQFDLKVRIQIAIISIVFVSMLFVALGTIFYNVEEYRSRLQEDLDDKMNSISVEIDMRLETLESITPDLEDWFTRELVKLSNIFRTDINIYGVGGDLIVSSRPELFNKGLVSKKISSQAYYELFENFQTNYFQPERIGRLNYLSAYSPIINNSGEYLGFINLPYFTHQDKYSQEISTFIVAFINLYVLLFLASILVALFIANQITRPLVAIRENLRKIELGKRNEPINYRKDDEIGKLVKEYNKKVDELAVSAELLARSERESAWREMAKQIAHEIKNPLTPMKLNIQHLQRFKGDGEEYRKTVNRIAQTLIGQIETLSEIATEFSNFAKIPTARKQEFNLASQIMKVIELYENDNRVTIRFDKGNCGNLNVNADREQLSRAFINLIKNGIQAIPQEREGIIKIKLKRREHMVVISVADNGTGIPEELREKMFSPNFTTKTSGMGLGLAIVKNIVENFSGMIRYETETNKGTTFYLEIPVFEEAENDTNNSN